MDWIELLNRAQFHGAARLASSRDRFQWLIAHLIFIFCSVAVVYVTVTRFYDNPTYIVQLTPVMSLKNFPTIVVCPQVHFLDHKIDEFLSKLVFPPSTNITYIREVLPQLAALYSSDTVYEVKDLESILELLAYNKLDVESASLRLTATCDETILKCSWRGRDANCSSLFHMELTRYGFCCIFNGRSFRREVREPKLIKKEVEKMHIYKMGIMYGLNIAIEQNVSKPPVNLDLSYKWITALSPGNMYVDVVSNGVPIPPGIEVWAGYTMKSIQLSEEARSLSPKLRRCYLANEPLKYFPVYQRRYCMFECKMDRVALRCKCALLNYPPVLGMPICGPRQLACARAAADRFDVCQCPLACEKETLNTRHFSFPLTPDTPTYDTFYDNLDLSKVTIIRLYVHGYTKTVNSRRSYFSRSNLFGQLGGVFNIFFGCSILTVLELLFLLRRYIRERRLATHQQRETWPFTR
ncbi:unnamed protein product [Pieris macdunnoughi]|uniref:Sodium channel protein Nach n=1 Tax=Pieris macdunnoughi TaxID=345717 RepID=A0A821XX91_9NEOP|nr:unnamed protein product [Pieris macdunnoughi]